MSNSKLKPCPFCGGEAGIKKDCCFGGDIYFVECQHCLTRGSGEHLKANAIAAWNKRTNSEKPNLTYAAALGVERNSEQRNS